MVSKRSNPQPRSTRQNWQNVHDHHVSARCALHLIAGLPVLLVTILRLLRLLRLLTIRAPRGSQSVGWELWYTL